MEFVGKHGEELLGYRPTVLPVSAKLALRAKLAAPTHRSNPENLNPENSAGAGHGGSLAAPAESPAAGGARGGNSAGLAVAYRERWAPDLGAGSSDWSLLTFDLSTFLHCLDPCVHFAVSIISPCLSFLLTPARTEYKRLESRFGAMEEHMR